MPTSSPTRTMRHLEAYAAGGDAHERGELPRPQRIHIEIVDRRAPARHRGSALGTALFVAWTLFGCAAHAQGWTAYRPNGGNTTNPDSDDERQRGSSYQPKDSTTTYTEFQARTGRSSIARRSG